MRKIRVAATQMACDWDIEQNLRRAEALVRGAAAEGANLVLLQELFATPYFCQSQDSRHLELASPATGHPVIERFAALARELAVVLPVSFFERAGNALFNSLAMIDADGAVLGVYRKSHIPDGPGYQEKYFFAPGDTGFLVFRTRYGRVGAGICWDQWFPEAARTMVLQGAELLVYPTAIGSEPEAPEDDTRDRWQRVMQGHAAANGVPVVASNRIGVERLSGSRIVFYGSSFVTDGSGAKIAEADRESEAVISAELDLVRLEVLRREWGFFRDRRPELYRPLLTLDGRPDG